MAGMSDIIRKQLLAQAAWLEVEAAIKSLEAAVLRGDREAAIAARQKVHDMLDSHLDLKCGALVDVLKAGGQ
jgi:hypothetical protein